MLDQLVEDRVAERRVAGPPDVRRQVVNEQRRHDAVEVVAASPRTPSTTSS